MIYEIERIAFLSIIHRIDFMTEIRFVCWDVELTCVRAYSLISILNCRITVNFGYSQYFRGSYIIQEVRHIFLKQLPYLGECVSNRHLCCSNVCSIYN
jgi:hypothetical protein